MQTLAPIWKWNAVRTEAKAEWEGFDLIIAGGFGSEEFGWIVGRDGMVLAEQAMARLPSRDAAAAALEAATSILEWEAEGNRFPVVQEPDLTDGELESIGVSRAPKVKVMADDETTCVHGRPADGLCPHCLGELKDSLSAEESSLLAGERAKILAAGIPILHLDYDTRTGKETFLGMERPDSPGHNFERVLMERAKPCPLCNGKAQTFKRTIGPGAMCDGEQDCPWYRVVVPLDAWEKLPRVSSGVAEVAEEIGDRLDGCLCADCWPDAGEELREWKDKLEGAGNSVAAERAEDPATPPGLRCDECNGQVGQVFDSEHRGLQCFDCGKVFPIIGFEEVMAEGRKPPDHRCPQCGSAESRRLRLGIIELQAKLDHIFKQDGSGILRLDDFLEKLLGPVVTKEDSDAPKT